jgi:hypothetical protein
MRPSLTDRVIANVSVEEDDDDGKFYYSLDGGLTRTGPFDDEVAATQAATDFLTTSFTTWAQDALFGKK